MWQMRPGRHEASEPALPTDSFGTLWYRYFFFGWLFRDVSRGSFAERAAAWRFNRRARRYLPIYLRRWLVLVVSSYVLGAWLDQSLSLVHPAAFFYLVSGVSFAMSVLIVRLWLGLMFE